MTSRREGFSRLWGKNWMTGQELLPLLREIGAGENGDILDLGCGESPFRDCFKSAKRYCRVDRTIGDPEIIVGDMLAIPCEEHEFDMVLLFQALTDVPRMEVALREVRRVLRPNGRLLILESMCYPEHDSPFDYYRLMPEGLRWLALETGYRVDQMTPLGGLFARFASLWNAYVMGKLENWHLLRPLALVGIAASNLLSRGLDRLLPHPNLAPDYLAVLSVVADTDADPRITLVVRS